MYDKSFVIADIPGLVEGASDGVGLGHEFLKHVQRCKILVHVVDVSAENPIRDFNLISNELLKFDKNLSNLTKIVVANKCDISSKENIIKFRNFAKKSKFDFFEVSAIRGKSSLESLMNKITEIV